MKHQMRRIVNEVFYDLQQASAEVGEDLDAEGLADYLGDRMHDDSAEYRSLPYEERRAIALSVAKEFL